MRNEHALWDQTTHYRIKVRGRENAEWLQSIHSISEVSADDDAEMEDVTVINVYTDQAGIIGLLRSLHGLGITILHFQMMIRKEVE